MEDELIIQRSPAWLKARAGKITASNFGLLVRHGGRRRMGWSREAYQYFQKLVKETQQGFIELPKDSIGAAWGQEQETLALMALREQYLQNELVEAGFVLHKSFNLVGATPDAYWIDNKSGKKMGSIQIKCPFNSAKHLNFLHSIRDSHSLRHVCSNCFWQVQGEMWVTQLQEALFVSFDSRQAIQNSLHIVPIKADPIAFERLNQVIPMAIETLNEMLLQDKPYDL